MDFKLNLDDLKRSKHGARVFIDWCNQNLIDLDLAKLMDKDNIEIMEGYFLKPCTGKGINRWSLYFDDEDEEGIELVVFRVWKDISETIALVSYSAKNIIFCLQDKDFLSTFSTKSQTNN